LTYFEWSYIISYILRMRIQTRRIKKDWCLTTFKTQTTAAAELSERLYMCSLYMGTYVYIYFFLNINTIENLTGVTVYALNTWFFLSTSNNKFWRGDMHNFNKFTVDLLHLSSQGVYTHASHVCFRYDTQWTRNMKYEQEICWPIYIYTYRIHFNRYRLIWWSRSAWFFIWVELFYFLRGMSTSIYKEWLNLSNFLLV